MYRLRRFFLLKRKFVVIPSVLIIILVLSILAIQKLIPVNQYPHNFVDSVFSISVYSTNQDISDLGGKGFAVDEHTIITNYHVVNAPRKITITDSKGKEFSATLFSYDIKSDIALLRTTQSLIPIGIENSLLGLGDKVFSYSKNDINEGRFVANMQSLSGMSIVLKFQEFAGLPTEKGDSGSPIVNKNGNVVGMISARTAENGKITTYAIPISDINKIIPYLMKNEAYPYVQLGFSASEVNNYHKDYPGLIINKVLPGYLASDEIQVGDIIKEFNGTAIKTYQDLGYELFTKGDSLDNITMSVIRNDKKVEIKIQR